MRRAILSRTRPRSCILLIIVAHTVVRTQDPSRGLLKPDGSVVVRKAVGASDDP